MVYLTTGHAGFFLLWIHTGRLLHHCQVGRADLLDMVDHCSLGGGRITRFHFGPLNVFVYISHWAARVNSQNRPHFEGDYRNWWFTRALLCAIQLAASWSNISSSVLWSIMSGGRSLTLWGIPITTWMTSCDVFVLFLIIEALSTSRSHVLPLTDNKFVRGSFFVCI